MCLEFLSVHNWQILVYVEISGHCLALVSSFVLAPQQLISIPMLGMALELNNGVEEGTDFLKIVSDFWIVQNM